MPRRWPPGALSSRALSRRGLSRRGLSQRALSRGAISRRTLLAGGAALLAGCNTSNPHDGDPDAAAVTPAPVPQSGSDRLAAVDESDLPAVEPPRLVSDHHLTARLHFLRSVADTLETLLEELPAPDGTSTNPTASTTANESEAQNETTSPTTRSHTTGTGDTTTPEREAQERRERVREEARERLADARRFLADSGSDGGDVVTPGRVRSQDAVELQRARRRTVSLRSLLWSVRIAYGRSTIEEVPHPSSLEGAIESFRSSIRRRCDGTGRAFVFLSAVESSLVTSLRHADGGDSHADDDPTGGTEPGEDSTGGTEPEDDPAGEPGDRPALERVQQRVAAHAKADLALVDAKLYYETYEAGLGDAQRCGKPMGDTVELLRAQVTAIHAELADRMPTRSEGGGTRDRSLPFHQRVRRRFAVPDELYERRMARARDLERDGWVAMPCTELGRLLLWYRATGTILSRLADHPVGDSDPVDLVAATREDVIERFARAVERSRDDILVRRYLQYAEGALREADAALRSISGDGTDADADRRQEALVRAYTALLQADGITANARPVAGIVRDGTPPD